MPLIISNKNYSTVQHRTLFYGFYWDRILSEKVVPLTQTCIMRFGVSMCGRTWPVLMFGLDYIFLFCLHSLNFVFEFENYLKYFTGFEAGSNNTHTIVCLRSHCNAYFYCLLANSSIRNDVIGNWWISSRQMKWAVVIRLCVPDYFLLLGPEIWKFLRGRT